MFTIRVRRHDCRDTLDPASSRERCLSRLVQPGLSPILYRLQAEEWSRTSAAIDAILQDESKPPAARLRVMVRFFFQSECDEAALGKQVSEKNLTRAEVIRWADAVSDMLLGSLSRFAAKRAWSRPSVSPEY